MSTPQPNYAPIEQINPNANAAPLFSTIAELHNTNVRAAADVAAMRARSEGPGNIPVNTAMFANSNQQQPAVDPNQVATANANARMFQQIQVANGGSNPQQQLASANMLKDKLWNQAVATGNLDKANTIDPEKTLQYQNQQQQFKNQQIDQQLQQQQRALKLQDDSQKSADAKTLLQIQDAINKGQDPNSIPGARSDLVTKAQQNINAGINLNKQDQAMLEKARIDANKARGLAPGIDLLGKAVDQMPDSGYLAHAKYLMDKATQFGGKATPYASAYETMDKGNFAQVTDNLAAFKRTTNMEAQMAKYASVTPDNTQAFNQDAIAFTKRLQEQAIEWPQFIEAYARAHNGSTNGLDEAWNKYGDANPVIDPKTNRPVPHAQTPWTNFVGGNLNPPGTQTMAMPGSVQPTPQGQPAVVQVTPMQHAQMLEAYKARQKGAQ